MPVTSEEVDATDEELQEIVDEVRLVMRDYTVNNQLLAGVQFSDDEIRTAVRLTVSTYNAMPPETAVKWRDIPEALLFLGTTRWLMLSESFLQIRNQVSVQTDGLGVVGIDDKYALYNQQMQQLRADFDQRARQLKTARNLAAGYGSISSGYANVSRFHE